MSFSTLNNVITIQLIETSVEFSLNNQVDVILFDFNGIFLIIIASFSVKITTDLYAGVGSPAK